MTKKCDIKSNQASQISQLIRIYFKNNPSIQ